MHSFSYYSTDLYFAIGCFQLLLQLSYIARLLELPDNNRWKCAVCIDFSKSNQSVRCSSPHRYRNENGTHTTESKGFNFKCHTFLNEKEEEKTHPNLREEYIVFPTSLS